jgi:hypothetical protein
MRWRLAFTALLDPALYPAHWLDEQVAIGEFILFTGAESAILTSIRTYPSGLREIHGQAAVGELREIVSALIPLAEQFGKQHGCVFASIASRPGWSRMMAPYGYETHQVEIRKAL